MRVQSTQYLISEFASANSRGNTAVTDSSRASLASGKVLGWHSSEKPHKASNITLTIGIRDLGKAADAFQRLHLTTVEAMIVQKSRPWK